MKIINIFLLALLVLVSPSSYADSSLGYVFEFGIEGGGDNLVATSKYDLNAGGGLYFGAGITLDQYQSDISYRVMLGYLSDDVDFVAPTGSSSFRVIPVDFQVYRTSGRHQYGGGLAYHIGPEWELCIGGCAVANFDDAIGFEGAYRYSFGGTGYIGVKFTAIDYKNNGVSVDGSTLGIYLGVGQ